MQNLLPGLLIGHATDLVLGSGVTAIVFEQPCVAAVCVLGGAPGGRDLGMLDPGSSVERIDAVVLSGGSAFGLDAAGGVQAALRETGRGERFAGQSVPLVAQAILFDLANGANKDWGRFSPYRDLGYAAAVAASETFALGSVGAGTGAATATCKGGVGVASATSPQGHTVAALAAVNAMGSATIGDGPHFWAAPFEQEEEFGGLGWPASITPADLAYRAKHRAAAPATTIGLIATDAALTKAQAHRLAIMAHDGLARAVLPAHAPMDGDTIFAVSTGSRPMTQPIAELTELGHLATQVFARAVARGVFEATALSHPGAQQAWRDGFAQA
jgi:L-aminopeptidase/D-esterase-like protein